MKIGGLQKNTLIDFPGKLACTIFTMGCNFRCPFCYSGDLVFERGGTIPEENILAFLEERKGFLEGVVICGGEPLMQPDLESFVSKIKDIGYLVKLDTNGTNSVGLKKLIDKGLIDYVAMDIKNSQDKYFLSAGIEFNLEEVKKSVELLKTSGVGFEFRTTVVPGLHEASDFNGIAEWIGGENVNYFLQRFKPGGNIDASLVSVNPYSDDELIKIKESISPYFASCRIR
jgi:pyruvate formate lyase activating enzyme